MAVRNSIAEIHDEVTAWRRDLHRHPELGFDTHRTAGIVAEKLRAFGCDAIEEGVAQAGVVAVIRGRSTGSGRVIALRADMDALPLQEETGLPHASAIPGAMHACGHDGHTAMLLGAARHLAETRNFDGTVVLLFQPAEEGGAGARVMCDEGVLDRYGVHEVYGMHNWPGLPVGQFAIRPGPFFAAADQFTIRLAGRGAHAAKPHEGIDPILVASHLVIALQSIAAREVDPVAQAVVSVTAVQSSSMAWNVIPPTVELRGTVRSLDEAVRDRVEARVRAITEGIAASFGAKAAIDYDRGYPVMANAETETLHAAEAARRVAGSCAEAPLIMGAEDFAFMLQARPGAYILVGNGDSAGVHNPAYEFDDGAIPAGVSWWAELVEGRMPAR